MKNCEAGTVALDHDNQNADAFWNRIKDYGVARVFRGQAIMKYILFAESLAPRALSLSLIF
jgi:hypothetical protein